MLFLGIEQTTALDTDVHNRHDASLAASAACALWSFAAFSFRAPFKTAGDCPHFAAGTIAAMVAEQIGDCPLLSGGFVRLLRILRKMVEFAEAFARI
jgi:hypothetical protein